MVTDSKITLEIMKECRNQLGIGVPLVDYAEPDLIQIMSDVYKKGVTHEIGLVYAYQILNKIITHNLLMGVYKKALEIANSGEELHPNVKDMRFANSIKSLIDENKRS